MNRKEIKKIAKRNLKSNYLISILVVFIVGVIVNGGYNFTTSLTQTNVDNTRKTNYQLVSDTVKHISKQSKDGKASGVIAPIFNNITESNSAVIGLLNSFNLYVLNKSVNIVIISLIGSVIIILIKIFIQDIFTVGKKRYFIEQRRYKTSLRKILFPFKTRKNVNIAFIILLKNIYEMLWSLTIVGGIIKHYQYLMIPYVLAENPNIKRKEAFNLSKEMMHGLKWKTFKVDFSLLGWEVLNILTLGMLDVFFLNAYKECIYAEVYMYIRDIKKKDLTNGYLLNDKYLEIDNIVNEEYPMNKFTIPVKEKNNSKKRDYNVKYTIKNYILMFFTFAFIGWLWEVLLHVITEGRFVNRGTMLGPWLPIYGYGGILILVLLKPLRNKPALFFISSMVLAGIVEYSTAWYLETVKGAKWWDYSGYFLNLNGRICLEGLFIFGLGGAAITYFIGPILNELYSKIKPRVSFIICIVLLALYGTDMVYSSFHPNTGKGITDYDEKL